MAYPDAMSFNHRSPLFSLLYTGKEKKNRDCICIQPAHLNTSYFSSNSIIPIIFIIVKFSHSSILVFFPLPSEKKKNTSLALCVSQITFY